MTIANALAANTAAVPHTKSQSHQATSASSPHSLTAIAAAVAVAVVFGSVPLEEAVGAIWT